MGRNEPATHNRENRTTGSDRGSLDELIEAVVERAVMQALGPYLHRLSEPEPIVYTIGQAAQALQVSPDTVARLVRRGTLPKVPHIDGRVLIPRHAVDALGDTGADTAAQPAASPSRSRSIRSAAPRSEPGMK